MATIGYYHIKKLKKGERCEGKILPSNYCSIFKSPEEILRDFKEGDDIWIEVIEDINLGQLKKWDKLTGQEKHTRIYKALKGD